MNDEVAHLAARVDPLVGRGDRFDAADVLVDP